MDGSDAQCPIPLNRDTVTFIINLKRLGSRHILSISTIGARAHLLNGTSVLNLLHSHSCVIVCSDLWKGTDNSLHFHLKSLQILSSVESQGSMISGYREIPGYRMITGHRVFQVLKVTLLLQHTTLLRMFPIIWFMLVANPDTEISMRELYFFF